MWIKPLVVLALIAYACWLKWRAHGFAKKPFIDPTWGCERQQDFNVRHKAIRWHDNTAYGFFGFALIFAAYVHI